MRAAFGFGGQKCSANSRVYVERPVHDELVRRLVEKPEAITIGDPVDRRNWLGPVIDQRAVDRYGQAVGEARRDGRVLIARRRSGDRFGGGWEFPGGKIEPGESPEESLRREIDEELGMAIEIGPCL